MLQHASFSSAVYLLFGSLKFCGNVKEIYRFFLMDGHNKVEVF